MTHTTTTLGEAAADLVRTNPGSNTGYIAHVLNVP